MRKRIVQEFAFKVGKVPGIFLLMECAHPKRMPKVGIDKLPCSSAMVRWMMKSIRSVRMPSSTECSTEMHELCDISPHWTKVQ